MKVTVSRNVVPYSFWEIAFREQMIISFLHAKTEGAGGITRPILFRTLSAVGTFLQVANQAKKRHFASVLAF
jgi:hypothetical protein